MRQSSSSTKEPRAGRASGKSADSAAPEAEAARPSVGGPSGETLTLSLHEHGVGFFLPPGAVLHASTFSLPYGALIEGEFVGDLTCDAGSVIIGASARLYGSITADRIYIEGTVGSRRGQRSTLMGRALIAASANSRINAEMRSRSWSLHAGAQIWGTISTIEDGALGGQS